jgi:hypothetical protein
MNLFSMLRPLGLLGLHNYVADAAGKVAAMIRAGEYVPEQLEAEWLAWIGVSGRGGPSRDADRKNTSQDQPIDGDPASDAPTPENGD